MSVLYKIDVTITTNLEVFDNNPSVNPNEIELKVTINQL